MIRLAVEEDIPRLIELGAMMHAESQFSVLTYSPEKVAELLRGLIECTDGLLIVAIRGDEIIGMMAATIQEHWMSSDLVACDLALFVEPKHRGGMAAVRLGNTYTGWALNSGAKLPMLGAMTGVEPEKTARFFGCLGYEPMGSMHKFVRV